jgi:pilus assembly protein CpaF
MRPDRLVVGECRGAEVRELLSAMNTGHAGGGGTIHANAAAAVPARLAALGALAGMGQDAVRLQVASAIDAVVHVERTTTGRQVASIGVLDAQDSGLAVTAALELLRGQVHFGPAWPQLADRLGLDPGMAPVAGSEPHQTRAAADLPECGGETPPSPAL